MSIWMRRRRNRHLTISIWESLIHCIISIFLNELSQEKDVTVNAIPPEPLSNWQVQAIHPSYPIHAKSVSLEKGPDREFTSDGIMTRRTSGLGYLPGKYKSC